LECQLFTPTDTLKDLAIMSAAEHELAIEKYSQQLKKNPDDIGALNNRGISLVSIGINGKDHELIKRGYADIARAASVAINCNIVKQNLKWSQNMLTWSSR
jgi:hypothetical protein